MLDGIIKGVLTSVLGLIVMCLAIYGWIWGDWFDDSTQALIFGGIGFGLMFVREKLAMLLIDWLAKKFGSKFEEPKP